MAIGSLKLTPSFEPNVTEYTATTTNASNKISATPENESAIVIIKKDSAEVKNGEACTWSNGKNKLTIEVSNGNASRTYTVNITKS